MISAKSPTVVDVCYGKSIPGYHPRDEVYIKVSQDLK